VAAGVSALALVVAETTSSRSSGSTVRYHERVVIVNSC
jgi:hypothetical protein